MKMISGGQTGVDRAALDLAIERGMDWGGWCPRGGWAEDLTTAPGLLARYPKLKETPQSNPLQRTEWNVRDSDATLIITDGGGMSISIGTGRAHQWARQHGKPELVVDATDAKAPAHTLRFGYDPVDRRPARERSARYLRPCEGVARRNLGPRAVTALGPISSSVV